MRRLLKASPRLKKEENAVRDERGTILIEFIGSFLLFFLLMMSILSLINIVTAQARVHYALTETANTLSMYGYAYSIADRWLGDTKDTLKDINDTMDFISKFRSGFAPWKNSAPASSLQAVTGFLGDSDVTKTAMRHIIDELILYNLSAGGQSGEDYLRSVRITKLNLTSLSGADDYSSAGGHHIPVGNSASRFPDAQGNIKLTVTYVIDYSFMGLPIPFNPQLKITQSVMTKIWYQNEGYDG